jgi:spore germination protein KB
MEKEKISASQLFSLICLFELGTALVVPLGIKAKQDAWIAVILGLGGGVVLFTIYVFLLRLYPGKTLISYAKIILGKYIGWPLGLLYAVFFTYTTSRVVRDFGELLVSSVYPKTPVFVINTLIIITITYVLYKGIEVVARTGEIYIVILTFLGVIGIFLVLISQNVNIKNLYPVLGEGWKPVLTTVFPHILVFPYGEMLCFTMILPYLNKLQHVVKIGLSAMIISGIIISFTIALNIAVLDVDTVSQSTFPLLLTIGKVNIAEFLQRLYPIAIFTLIIGNFFKISIYFYVAVMCISELFKVEKQKIIWPIGIIIIFSSILIASNFTEHLTEAFKIGPMYVAVIMEAGIPLLLLIIALIRKTTWYPTTQE